MKQKTKKKFRIFPLAFILCGVLSTFPLMVFAEESDPIAVVNNLSDFIFQLTKVVGGIIVGYSIIQIGLSFTSHDASQRVNGILFFVGGAIIMCAKVIVNIIAG